MDSIAEEVEKLKAKLDELVVKVEKIKECLCALADCLKEPEQ